MMRLTINNIERVVVHEYKDRHSLKEYFKIYVYMKSNKISDVREYYNDCPATVKTFMINKDCKTTGRDKLPNVIVTRYLYK